MTTKDRQAWLEEQVAKTLQRIAGETDAKKLRSLHTNITAHPEINEDQRERLDDAVVTRLWAVAPKVARAVSGPKDGPGRIYLQKVLDELNAAYDLSGNQVGSHVKTGGDMLAGRLHVSVYISYKTMDARNLRLRWAQDLPDSDPRLELSLRHLGKTSTCTDLHETSTDGTAMAARYRAELTKLLD
ncbi:hypothetical protein V8J36_09995 [Frigidibacter sp. MR17.14]|uniref:hypothetical protein n=1 Tax=Frigidibacter sp. MR17.14 TaxID=3126509 RepID=UPI003012C442